MAVVLCYTDQNNHTSTTIPSRPVAAAMRSAPVPPNSARLRFNASKWAEKMSNKHAVSRSRPASLTRSFVPGPRRRSVTFKVAGWKKSIHWDDLGNVAVDCPKNGRRTSPGRWESFEKRKCLEAGRAGIGLDKSGRAPSVDEKEALQQPWKYL